LTAVLPPCEPVKARSIVESHFGSRLRPGASSYYNNIVWRWYPYWVTPRWRFWGKRIAPLPGVVEIRLYDNLDPQDELPWHAGHPKDAWVVDVVFNDEYAVEPLRDFLASCGTIVE
jgi:hypothetical protein